MKSTTGCASLRDYHNMKTEFLQRHTEDLRDGILHKAFKPGSKATAITSRHWPRGCPNHVSPHQGWPHVPLARVHPEAVPVAHPPGSALALQSARLADKGLHQRAHLAALVEPKEMVWVRRCMWMTHLTKNLKKPKYLTLKIKLKIG